jgi:cell division protein FtsW (lipid II flippase)
MSQIAAIEAHVRRRHPEAPPIASGTLLRVQRLVFTPATASIIAAAALSLIGVAAISTTEPGLAARQGVFLLVGMGAAGIVAAPHYVWLRRLSYPLLAGTVILLLFVMIPFVPEGLVRPRNGARRWINLGLTDFQPSEIAKIAFVLALANWLRLKKNYRRLTGLFVPFILTFIPLGLILIEPDLGTSLLFLPTLFAMLIAAGAKLWHIALIVTLGLGSAPAMYPLLRDHQKDRIDAMIAQVTGDTRHDDDIGFQAARAQTLVAAGGIGGLGKDHARDLVVHNRLPEEHNDMIFAVVAARWGLAGGMLTILAYLVFIAGGLFTAAACRDAFGRLIVVGVVAICFAQMTINIGMTIGLLPITGMTLPFVSYGGSSLVATWMMAGLILNVGLRRPRYLEREPFAFDEEESV